MTAVSAGKLYTPALLSLATQLAEFPLSDDLTARAEARSRTCGSTIDLGVGLDAHSRISKIGMQVTACAVGQASAALLALHAVGVEAREAGAMEQAVHDWLSGKGPMPNWPGFEALAPALPHAGRHGALMLPWKALSQALFKVNEAS